MKWFQTVQMLKQKVAWLEASNMDLRRELEEARDRIDALSQCALESQVSYVMPRHLFISKSEEDFRVSASKGFLNTLALQ